MRGNGELARAAPYQETLLSGDELLMRGLGRAAEALAERGAVGCVWFGVGLADDRASVFAFGSIRGCRGAVRRSSTQGPLYSPGSGEVPRCLLQKPHLIPRRPRVPMPGDPDQ